MSTKNKNFAQSYVGEQKINIERPKSNTKSIGLSSTKRESLSSSNGLFSGLLGTVIFTGFVQGFTPGVIGLGIIFLALVVRINTKLISDTLLKEGN